ncbi:MAG: LysR family transcriptional regulator [Myxococcota bacterium]
MNTAHVVTPDLETADGLHRIDLNLVVALDALVRERSVTAAARRAGVTQSAMSHTLRRLRDLLGDALLVRGKGGMVLTPRAEALAVPLRSGLMSVGRALAQAEHFDPAEARRSFRIASPDLFDVLAGPGLLRRTRAEAPGIDLAMMPFGAHGVAESLETGELDLAVLPIPDEPDKAEVPSVEAPGLRRRVLFRESLRCFLRRDHPALSGKRPRLSLRKFVGLSHAMVSPRGQGVGLIDAVLAEHGHARRIALRIPNFYSAPAIIADSDLVLTAPSALRSLLPADSPLCCLAPPIALPQHAVAMVWHERFADDPGHRWLRQQVSDVAVEISDVTA